MPTRIITATVTSGSMADLPAGSYITFGQITSDTGPVEDATVLSAALHLSSHKTYTIYGALNVIYGDKKGDIVGTTDELARNSEVHAATYKLHDLSEKLLSAAVDTITLGVIAQIGTASNRINVRDGCTLTLTIEYDLNHKPVPYYDGEKWVECLIYYYDGNSWIECEARYGFGHALVLLDYDGKALADNDRAALSSF